MPSAKTEEKKINGGYIYLARHILDSDIFLDKPAEWLKIWIYILLKVQYCNGRRSPKGTGYFNWEAEKENLPGVRKWQWHNCIRFLKKERMVATQKTTRGNLIEVLQYHIYQNPETYRSKTSSNTKTTHEQHTSNTIIKRSKGSKRKIINSTTESQLDELIKIYNQKHPEVRKLYGVGGMARARDYFEGLTIRGIKPKEIEQAILDSPYSEPWKIYPLREGERKTELDRMVESIRDKKDVTHK